MAPRLISEKKDQIRTMLFEGRSISEIAEAIPCSERAVYRTQATIRRFGAATAPTNRAGPDPKITPLMRDTLCRELVKEPDMLGLSALQQTVRLLPFVLPFIVTVVIIAACLPRVKHYGLIYLAGGAITLGSATALATTLAPNVSESKVMGLTALVGVGLGLHFQHSNAISNRIHKDLRDRIEGAALLNMSLMGGISMALIIAGAVYENRGMSLLKSALGSFDYDEGDLREALAGVSRETGGGDEAHSMIAYGANATCKAIALLFYIVASSGALCLACGVLAVFGRSRAKKSQ